eukprot:836776-Amphidinium_carterae.2
MQSVCTIKQGLLHTVWDDLRQGPTCTKHEEPLYNIATAPPAHPLAISRSAGARFCLGSSTASGTT